MTGPHRLRRLAPAMLLALLALVLASCSTEIPNTTFNTNSEFGRAIDALTYRLLFLGGIVFVLVEGLLLFTIWKFRHKEGNPTPRQVHGNTTLEITWTLIPALILAFIAVPTVRTIFQTQARAIPDALQVQVIGHQWWWEFRYPQYNVTTANELYIPAGRTVNFALQTADVLHSFWIPRLGGKRDLIANRTNFIWFTPDSTGGWNGFCAEFCGASHANMRFRAFTVTEEEFEQWIAHQQAGPAFRDGASVAVAAPGETLDEVAPAGAVPGPAAEFAVPPIATPVSNGRFVGYPREQLALHLIPNTPVPRGLTIAATEGDPARGEQIYRTSACIGCHVIEGVSFGQIGPNLTTFGSRTSLGAGLYPNDQQHLSLWIKNSPAMKPGSLMPPFAPNLPGTMGNLDDQQIADIAAYLLSLR
jgi:cytochrome c oxidase subunit II